MKVYFRLTLAILFIAAATVCMPGCEYDVTQSQWEKKYPAESTPTITAVQPAVATPGVNLITIVGENFAVAPDSNAIYFDNLVAEYVDYSATSITVRRPNLVTDSCVVKVASLKPTDALVVAKYQPYKIDPVIGNYGTFIENKFLTSVTVDADENVYVTSVDSNYIFKVAPGASKVILNKATQVPVDIKIGPDGRLYMVGGASGTGGNRDIYVCNVTTGVIGRWVRLASGKNVKFGEFDANGYFYVGGGNKVDIWVIAPDSTFTAANLYTTNEILAMKIYDNYLYVAARTGTGTSAVIEIYKHAIGDNGALAAGEFVLNYTASPFGSRTLRAITFSADGVMFLATDDVNPILVVDSQTNQLDYFYKGIVPAYIRDFNWGTGNYLYVVSGRTDVQNWTVDRVDMGSPGIR
jgi:hypothetical protein